MNNLNQINGGLPADFFDELRKLFADLLNLTKVNISDNPFTVSETNSTAGVNETVSLSQLILRNFELMLESTGGMTKNMGSIEGGISVLLKTILQIMGSLTSGGGAGGVLDGLFGSLFGLIGGPIGSLIGGMLGSGLNLSGMFGSSQTLSNLRQMPLSFSGRNPNIINQVVIKNPVTFSKAYDVEVRNRLVRGGIDL